MSRGPGRWQRAVLDTIWSACDPDDDFTHWVSVDEIYRQHLGENDPPTASEREAIRRAMRTLADKGEIEIGYITRLVDVDGGWHFIHPVKRTVLAARFHPGPLQRAVEQEDPSERVRLLKELVAEVGVPILPGLPDLQGEVERLAQHLGVEGDEEE